MKTSKLLTLIALAASSLTSWASVHGDSAHRYHCSNGKDYAAIVYFISMGGPGGKSYSLRSFCSWNTVDKYKGEMWGMRSEEDKKLFKACEDEDAPDIQKCLDEWAEKNVTQEPYTDHQGQAKKRPKMKVPFTHGRPAPTASSPESGTPAGR